MFSSPLWAVDNLKPGDFAGAIVYSGREGSLLMLEIPEEVYQGFRRPDLGDIRIFDASENPVSFVIRERPRELFTPPSEEVRFFPWDGGRENNFPANTDIEINTSGGVLRIRNQGEHSVNPPVFLADLSLLSYVPSSLRVRIENQGRNFNIPVTIHYSGDLSNWRAFDKRQVLASFGGTVQDTLELPETGDIKDMRYLLIRFSWETPIPVSMTVFFSPREKPGEFHEIIIQGKKSPDGKTIRYNTEAFYPAESIDFILDEADSIPVLIKNRFSEEAEWNIRARGTLFRYNSSGSIVRNPPFEIASNATFWELEATGGLPFGSVPEMLIRCKPRELIFPARGSGPWTLVFGNPACPPLSSRELLPLTGQEEFEPAVFTGELRYAKTAMPVLTERDYRVYILWAFLGTAVLILSILAFYIAKSMRK